MGKSMLGRSIPGHSILHKLDARVKFLSTLFLMVATLSIRDPRLMLFFLIWTLGLMAASRIRPGLILRSVRPIIVIILFAVVLHLLTAEGQVLLQAGPLRITLEGLYSGLMTALRLTLMMINTSLLLTLTTPPLAVADALESLLGPLRLVRFPVDDFAMMMSIALRFVPTLMDEAVKIMKAQSSRGANYDTGGLLKRAGGLVSILVPLFVSSFRRADELAIAMDARCYRGGARRTRLYAARLTAVDLAFMAVAGLLLILALTAVHWLPPLGGLMGSVSRV